jgi:hypothetical protein
VVLSSAPSLAVQPLVSYPRQVEVGQTYLLTVDLRAVPGADGGVAWPYEHEEYPIHCMLESVPFFRIQPLGTPAIVLHRFGGTYGPARFLVTGVAEESDGTLRVNPGQRRRRPHQHSATYQHPGFGSSPSASAGAVAAASACRIASARAAASGRAAHRLRKRVAGNLPRLPHAVFSPRANDSRRCGRSFRARAES